MFQFSVFFRKPLSFIHIFVYLKTLGCEFLNKSEKRVAYQTHSYHLWFGTQPQLSLDINN